MATKEQKIFQYRVNRDLALNGWRNGGPDGSARWEGDNPNLPDAKIPTENDIFWMKLQLSEGGLSLETEAKYQLIVNAEQAEFERLDAIYETAKAAAQDD
jgi:hypothetical protein